MLLMIARNRVQDFAGWHRIFASHQDAHRAAGLQLRHLGRDLDDPSLVFFVFECESLERARAFIGAPQAAEAGKDAGLLESGYHFVETTASYGA